MAANISNPLVLIFAIGVYGYSCAALMALTMKLDMANTWMAWVPLMNLYLFLRIAGQPGWWMLLALVPFVNIAVFAYVAMVAAEKRERPCWWGLAITLPPAAIVFMGILAFTEPGQRDHKGTITAGSMRT